MNLRASTESFSQQTKTPTKKTGTKRSGSQPNAYSSMVSSRDNQQRLQQYHQQMQQYNNPQSQPSSNQKGSSNQFHSRLSQPTRFTKSTGKLHTASSSFINKTSNVSSASITPGSGYQPTSKMNNSKQANYIKNQQHYEQIISSRGNHLSQTAQRNRLHTRTVTDVYQESPNATPSNRFMSSEKRASLQQSPVRKFMAPSQQLPNLEEECRELYKIFDEEDPFDMQEKKLEVFQLQAAMKALNYKINLQSSTQQENEILKQCIQAIQDAQGDLESVVEETSAKMNIDKEKSSQYKLILQQENDALTEQTGQIEAEIQQNDTNAKATDEENDAQEAEILKLEKELEELIAFKADFQTQVQDNDALHNEILEMSNQIEKIDEEHVQEIEKINQEKDDIIVQNGDLKVKIQEKLAQNEQLRIQIERFDNILKTREIQMLAAQRKKTKLDQLLSNQTTLKEEIQTVENYLEQMTESIETDTHETSQARNKLQEHSLIVKSETEELNGEIDLLKTDLNNKIEIIDTLKQENDNINKRADQLEQLLYEQEVDETDGENVIMKKATSCFQDVLQMHIDLKQQYEITTNKLIENEESRQEAQTASLHILGQVKNKNLEIEKLQRNYAEIEKSKEVEVITYVPVQGDHIDQKLASYINRAPAKMRNKLAFERESHGVYRYLKKRVFMKIEKDTIIIRTGGGYMTIDEFVESYCGGEENLRNRIAHLVHGRASSSGRHSGNGFETFYFTQRPGQQTLELDAQHANEQPMAQ